MEYSEVVNKRDNVTKFDPSVKISKREIESILLDAMKAPSAWNLQHWYFIAFHTNKAKEKLLPIANWQRQIVESSVTIAVLGDLEANKESEKVLYPLLREKAITHDVMNKISNQIEKAYKDSNHPRDNAFLNSSLAAMQLVLSAQDKGFDTGIIGGFKTEEFSKEFGIDKRYVPVMLITIGKSVGKAHKSYRLPLKDKVKFI